MYAVSIAKSINRILMTPLGSRVMRPEYGSLLYTLLDRDANDEFRVKATKYSFEAINKTYTKIVDGKKVTQRIEPRVDCVGVGFDIYPVTGKVSLKIKLKDRQNRLSEVEVQVR